MAADDRLDIPAALPASALRRACDPAAFDFATTDDLAPIDGFIGQDRAIDAIRFGAQIKQPGFNLFALGPEGSGRLTAIRAILEKQACTEPCGDDWVYVNNFDHPHKPKAIRLAKGLAIRFRDAMVELIDDLRITVPGQFETDDYRSRRRVIDEEFEGSQQGAFESLREKAAAENIAILRTPMGFALAPLRDGKVIKPEEFEALPEDERTRIQATLETLNGELEEVIHQLPRIEKDRRNRIRELNAEIAEISIGSSIAATAEKFVDVEAIQDFLETAKRNLIKNVALFLADGSENQESPFPAIIRPTMDDPRFAAFMVNVFSAADADGTPTADEPCAPIVYEKNPTLGNLIGRVEHLSEMGALVTNFLLIKPGALHRANGGYLVLDARRVLTEPFAWDALKRTLKNGTITITSPGAEISPVRTISLEPEPIPADIKVVLFGEPMLYYLLVQLDPEFSELFKVQADFDTEIKLTDDSIKLYARLIASIAKKQDVKPIDKGGVARLIEEAIRAADDSERISLRIGHVADLIHEADFWAASAARKTVNADDVEKAVVERRRRRDRLRERGQEAIERGTVLIDTDGEQVGQVNGLSVLDLGNYRFGRPSRITARVRMGTGKIVDIEREVDLGGPLHSKGVFILSSYLATRFALDRPMSLWASIAFEQSYGGVDGDSASSTELYALL
ncbi:MAG: AAA family ATPase, partial [Hyphomicrobiales bacterium]|nr:AAA family ATPase [Hyphomicrobiales bacterium]